MFTCSLLFFCVLGGGGVEAVLGQNGVHTRQVCVYMPSECGSECKSVGAQIQNSC